MEKIGMSMVRTMGVNEENKNYWYDHKSRNIYKTEPLLIFSKPIELKKLEC